MTGKAIGFPHPYFVYEFKHMQKQMIQMQISVFCDFKRFPPSDRRRHKLKLTIVNFLCLSCNLLSLIKDVHCYSRI